ncbi:MAG: hypothetical protein ACRC7O_12290 [Fimbriiglobus sp.]
MEKAEAKPPTKKQPADEAKPTAELRVGGRLVVVKDAAGWKAADVVQVIRTMGVAADVVVVQGADGTHLATITRTATNVKRYTADKDVQGCDWVAVTRCGKVGKFHLQSVKPQTEADPTGNDYTVLDHGPPGNMFGPGSCDWILPKGE